jgi:hypothetical protein
MICSAERRRLMVSILTKISAGPNNETAHCQVRWDEPGKSDAAINVDVWVHNVGQSPEEIEKMAVAEAVRVARSFLAYYDSGS